MKPLNKFDKTLLASALALCSASTFAAYNDEGTDYSNAAQSYHVWNEALKPVDLVNSILCFTGQMKFAEFINAGPYLALADEGICFKDSGSDSSNSQASGASNTPSYTKIIINAVRASVDDPLVVSVWMPEMGGGGGDKQAIKFKAIISKGPSETDPFGSFTFNYNMFDSFDAGNSMGGGEIKTVDIPGKIGFTLFEDESGGGRTSGKNSSVVMSADRTEGYALTSFHESNEFQTQSSAFGLAFNSSNVLLQSADTYDELPFKSNNPNSGNEKCLSRTTFDESVWRYDLYDADSGARVDVSSGMSFKYDSNDDGTPDSYGHVGYWGLWAEHSEALTNGMTIKAEEPGTNSTTDYTLIKAPGRLIKNTVQRLDLTGAHGVEFEMFGSDAQTQGYQNWVVKYLTTDDGVETAGFYKVAGASQGENGPTQTPLQTPLIITINTNEPLNMNSRQLGGPVKYRGGDSFITFFEQEYVNGSETGEGQLLANGSVTFRCVFNCPKANLDLTMLGTFNGAYLGTPQNLALSATYTYSTTGDNPLTLMKGTAPVRYVDGITTEALQQAHSPYSWGFRSGALVTEDVFATLEHHYDVLDATKVSVFYVWETGINSFNQTASVMDAGGKIKTFDKPIQFPYTHTSANDRSGDAGSHDGQVFMLNYGGNGELFGIPSEQDNKGHQHALFTIADGTLLGGDNQYVVKAREIEGSMKQTDGACTDLTLTEPAAPVPTSATGSADIGDMPTVTGSPSVIGGVLQTTTP